MYDNYSAPIRAARRKAFIPGRLSALLVALFAAADVSQICAQDYESDSLVRKISSRSEKLELTTNTSRILTLDKNIPRVQVNNPELVAVTPLSAKDVQISAKKAGVTQVNLWDEDGNIHTIDVLIYGDARELALALQTQFPHSSIRVYRYSESLVLTGFVDRPDHVGPILRLAEDYAPKVINNINVGGVQQILLKVKIMEVNRSKLRQLGVDWAQFSNSGVGVVSSVSGLISEVAQTTRGADAITPNVNGGPGVVNNLGTFQFGVINGGDTFFGFVRFLQERQIAKTLAEPNIVAVSGRPAQFIVGGEVPILMPSGLGTVGVEYKSIGTVVDFLPIVLGNGNIRLEVRPQVSERNDANGIQLENIFIPGFNTRRVDTAVEMKAGEMFALAGLIQERTVSRNRGIPYLSDLPVIGVPFRETFNDVEEVELLVMVTPEFVDPINAHEAPCGGPGYATTNPTNAQLYCAGHVEVPVHCHPISGLNACGVDPCGPCATCGPYNGCNTCGPGQQQYGGSMPLITDGMTMPGGIGYDDSMGPAMITDQNHAEGSRLQPRRVPAPMPAPGDRPSPRADDLQLPSEGEIPPDASYLPGQYGPPRQPVFMRNASRPNNPQSAAAQPASPSGDSGLIGPIGYDVP